MPTSNPEEPDYLPDERPLAGRGLALDKIETNLKVDLWQLGDVGAFTKERPLELAVFDSAYRTRLRKLHTRVLPKSLPVDALIRVNDQLLFVCPELIVMHMASYCTVLQLAKIIMELCGTYSLGPNPDERGRTKFQLEPVTSIKRIRHYMGLLRMRGGTKTLRAALDIAMDGSASPAETVLALMMSLPPESGGYGFAKPDLNASLHVPDELRSLVGGEAYVLDAFWRDAYSDLEYESTDFHLDPLAAASLVAARDGISEADPAVTSWRREFISKADADRRRMRDIQTLGILVIPVTSFDLGSVARLDQVAFSLASNHLWEEMILDEWTRGLQEGAYAESREKLLRALCEDI